MAFQLQKSLILPELERTSEPSKSHFTFVSSRDFLVKSKVPKPEDSERTKKSIKTRSNASIVQLKEVFAIRQAFAVPNHYHMLPDESWAIYSTKDIEDNKYISLLSSLTTLLLSLKYNMSSWHGYLIDYALESVDNYALQFKDYDEAFRKLIIKRLPLVQFGGENYQFNILALTEPKTLKSLKQVLIECFRLSDKLLLIHRNYNCSIMKCFDFYYLFSGCPTNSLGYRRFEPGPACLLRFSELDSLVRRIEFGCNQDSSRITNYFVVNFKIASPFDEVLKKVSSISNTEALKRAKKSKEAKVSIKGTKDEYSTDEIRQVLSTVYNNAKKNCIDSPSNARKSHQKFV